MGDKSSNRKSGPAASKPTRAATSEHPGSPAKPKVAASELSSTASERGPAAKTSSASAPKAAPARSVSSAPTPKPAPAGSAKAGSAAKRAPAGKSKTQTARIRPAKSSDLTALCLLFDAYRVFYRKTSDVKLAHRFIGARLKQKDSVLFVAENPAGELQGFVQLYPSFSSTAASPIYVLNDLFVAPKGRQQGIGEALMHAALVHAKKKGCARLDLATERTNRTAQRLYEKLGYQKSTGYFHYSLPLL